MAKYKTVYLVADLRRVGPTNQTLNIICNANDTLNEILVLSLFNEPKDTLKPIFEKKGITCKSLSLNRINFIAGFFKLFFFLKKNDIQLLHSYGIKPDILLFFVSKFFKIPYVITQRCIPIEDYPPRMNKIVGNFIDLLHTFVLRHSSNVVTCSKHLAKVMDEKYHKKNITPIQNGIDLERFTKKDQQNLRKQYGYTADALIFISTGLFLERKHNNEIIEAFLDADIENSYLLMLGDGPLYEILKRKYGNNKQVCFLGKVSNIPDYLSLSNYFISASDSEGLPNAVLEALACGCPVILSDIPQHQEILNEMPNCGTLFPLHDTKVLTEIIKKTTTNSVSYSDTTTAIKNSPFTMKSVGKLYRNYYKSLELFHDQKTSL